MLIRRRAIANGGKEAQTVMTVNLAVAVSRVVVISHTVRLANRKGHRLAVAIKGAPKRLKIASAIEPKTSNARARQINVVLKVDGYIGA